MRTSQTGIDLIKYYEGLRLDAYKDVAGIWTIGYGHIGPIRIDGKRYSSVADAVSANGGQPVSISEDYAEELLREELVRFENGVSSAVKREINQNQFDAFVSLSYNIGVGAFSSSTAVKRFNNGDIEGAAEAITWWNKATVNGQKQVVQGLVNRRAAEKALFLQPANVSELGDSGVDSTRVSDVEENSPRRDSLGRSRTMEGAGVAGAGGAVGAGAAWLGGDDDEDQASTGDNPPAPDPAPDTTPEPDSQPEQPATDGPEDPETETDTGSEAEPSESGDEGDETDRSTDEETGTTTTEQPEDIEPDEADDDGAMGTEISEPPIDEGISKAEYTEAIQIIAGIIVVLAVLYIIYARIDDWMKHKR